MTRWQKIVRDNPVDPGASNAVANGIQPQDGGTSVHSMPLLTWKKLSGIASYRVQVSATKDFADPVLVDEAGIAGAQYQLKTALQNDTTYYWRLQPKFTDGTTGGWSGGLSFTIELPVPTVTTPSQGAIVNTPRPTLSWKPQNGAAQYAIELSMASSFSSFADQGTSTATQYKIAAVLGNDQLYYWRVRIVDANGVAGSWSEACSFRVAYPEPANPTPASERLNQQQDALAGVGRRPRCDEI